MTKLDALINKLIPDGVEFKELVTLAEIGTGSSDRKDSAEDGKYPFYVRSKDVLRINSFEYDEEAIVIPGEGGIGEIFHYVSGKYALHQRAYRIHPTTKKLSTKFLYYYMFANFKSFIMQKAVSATVTSIRKPMIEKFEVPLPPLEIQNEIVRILDNFTELEEELEEELEARRKQYEYYRNSLLTFDDAVEWKTLEELCTKVTDGSHFSPKASEKGYPMPSVKDMRFNNFDLSNCKKISEKDYTELVKTGCKPLLNDVLIAKDGSMLKYAFPIKEELDLVILSSIAILRPKTDLISPDYFAHYFRQDSFREIVIRDYSSKGGVPRIVLKNFKKIKIPVPTLEKQKQIVTILDRFETLCNDITSGLPAEIEARHKQYEYYRDKLLTFKRKSA